jgi:glycosyltransferase involved in cell wall biosynthesis
MSIKVSVIIPVYNAEKYLAGCIESLLRQTLKECEFIFVNDGSRDSSREILEEYKKSDSRMILINQENQGVSIARNNGIKIASGDYLGFVDADDYIEKDMYEKLYCTAKQHNCDITISNFESHLNGHKVIIDYPFPMNKLLNRQYITRELLPYFIKAENLNSVCNKIYRQSLVNEHKVRFPEKVALGEDGMFNIQCFSRAASVIYLDYIGYFYREVEGSATRSFLEKDYFNRALEIYLMDLPEEITVEVGLEDLRKFKSIKLINSVKGCLFTTLSTELRFVDKYNYMKKMVTNEYVKNALEIYINELYEKLGRYERFVVRMMKFHSILGLYAATSYSRLRNK